MLKNKKTFYFSILTLILFFFIPIHSRASIITMFKPLGFIAAAIADKVIQVEVLLPDGYNIHNYSLRPLDVLKIKNSEFIILIGDETEPIFLKNIISHFKIKTLKLSSLEKVQSFLTYNFKNLTNKKIHHLEYQQEINSILHNTYLWLSPQIAIESAIVIHNILIEMMPQKKIVIDDNLKRFKNNLLKLNKNIKKKFLSFKEKKYYVLHNSYQYFEKYYGLRPLGYFNKYFGIQIGAQYLYNIKSTLLKKKATCIFTESQFHSKIIDTIIRGTRINKGILDPFGIEISLGKDSYIKFLLKMSDQYIECFKKH